jgi:hypothetical protein
MWGGQGIGPGAELAWMRQERTDYGYDVICWGAYKHLQPQVISEVLFGEAKTVLNVEGIGQLYDFVTDEVLVTLASFTK